MTPKMRVRGRSLFRQKDMERAMRGAKASGFEIGGVEVTADGVIRILPKDAIGQGGNDLDDWIVKRDAHSAQRS